MLEAVPGVEHKTVKRLSSVGQMGAYTLRMQSNSVPPNDQGNIPPSVADPTRRAGLYPCAGTICCSSIGPFTRRSSER